LAKSPHLICEIDKDMVVDSPEQQAHNEPKDTKVKRKLTSLL